MCQRQFKMNNGTPYIIEYSDEVASIKDLNGTDLGSFTFALIEEEIGYESYEYLKITHMDLKITRQGIGKTILEYVIDVTGLYITASENDGNVYSDGSHLTGMGPAFIEKMRKIKLVTSNKVYE